MAGRRQINNVAEILERYGRAKARKNESDGLRQEAGQYSWPSAQDQWRNANMSEGQLRTIHLYDSTSLMAAYTMTSNLFSYLMPVGSFWFGFTAQDEKINEDPTMQQWMSNASSLTHKEIWRSNFQREMFLTIRSMVVFGTGVISVKKSGKNLVFQSHHIGFMSFDDNNDGEIDTVYRQIFYTVRQAAQEFGKENLNKTALKAFNAGKMETKCEYVHVVAPNEDFDKDKTGSSSKKVKSLYIAIEDKEIVKSGGFDELPYLVARFSTIPGEIMGRCPAIELLPEIKMLNRMKRTFIEQSEKAVNPAMIVEDDGVVGQPVTDPGGMVYIRSGAQMPQPWQTGTNVALNAEIIANQQSIVKEGFFNNRFQSLDDQQNMTAFEVGVRKEDDLSVVSPAVTSLQKETLDPLLGRALNLLIGMGKIEKPPISFDFDVAYQGRLALAMAAVQSNAMLATLSLWAPYAQVKPEIFENIDFDKSIRESWLAAGAPANNLNDFDEMMAQREEIQNIQMAGAQAGILDTGSKAYKNMGTAPEEGSATASLME
jgi:hypothetical protein